jgi:hypothetical protein
MADVKAHLILKTLFTTWNIPQCTNYETRSLDVLPIKQRLFHFPKITDMIASFIKLLFSIIVSQMYFWVVRLEGNEGRLLFKKERGGSRIWSLEC